VSTITAAGIGHIVKECVRPLLRARRHCEFRDQVQVHYRRLTFLDKRVHAIVCSMAINGVQLNPRGADYRTYLECPALLERHKLSCVVGRVDRLSCETDRGADDPALIHTLHAMLRFADTPRGREHQERYASEEWSGFSVCAMPIDDASQRGIDYTYWRTWELLEVSTTADWEPTDDHARMIRMDV